MDHLVKNAIEIHLNKYKCNRNGGFILSQALLPIANMSMNMKAWQSRVGLTTTYNRQVYHEADRFWSSQFPDDEYTDGPQNNGLINIPPPDVAASPRTFYRNCSIHHQSKRGKQQVLL